MTVKPAFPLSTLIYKTLLRIRRKCSVQSRNCRYINFNLTVYDYHFCFIRIIHIRRLIPRTYRLLIGSFITSTNNWKLQVYILNMSFLWYPFESAPFEQFISFSLLRRKCSSQRCEHLNDYFSLIFFLSIKSLEYCKRESNLL